MTNLMVVQRLLLITFIAGIIGYERERHGRAAGFRTHILVGLGSCLVMLTGIYLSESLTGKVEFDPTRMAAQVISGIGFLGAGTILRFRASVRGLTTAASLWAIGGIGLAVGAGFLWGAVTTALIIVIALFGFARLERAMRRDAYQTLAIETMLSGDDLAKIRQVLAEYEVEIRDMEVKQADELGTTHVEFHVKMFSQLNQQELLQNLQRLEHTKRAYWI